MWSEFHRNILVELTSGLNEAGIKWFLMGNYQGLPAINQSKDIDLVVKKKWLDPAFEIIKATLKRQGFLHYSVRRFEQGLCGEFFRPSPSGVDSIKVDLLHGFVFRGAEIIGVNDFLANSEIYNGIPVASQPLQGFILWVKPFLTGAGLKAKYLDQIEAAISNNTNDFEELIDQKFGSCFSRHVKSYIRKRDFSALNQSLGKARFFVWVQSFINAPVSTSMGLVIHIYRVLILRYSRPAAAFISVAGPDGVGKTTFIELLKNQLAVVLVKDETAFHIEHFRPHILPNIKQLISGKSYDQSTEEFHNPHRAKPVGTFSSFIRIVYYWLDYVLGYWLRTRKQMANGKVFIFDRYFYDFIVDPRRSRLSLPLWLRKLFFRFTPQPDLVFFLDCDASVVYARKQELPKAEIARQLTVYRELTKEHPKRFVVLDASQPPEASVRLAVTELVKRSFLTW